MNLITNDLGLPLLASALWLALAVPVRLAGGRVVATLWTSTAVYDWNVRRIRAAADKLGRRGWSGRHGLPDVLVSAVRSGTVEVAELETIAQRPPVEAQAELTEEEQAEVAAMQAAVSTVRADFTFTEPTRAARKAALQADTILIPLVKLEEVDAIMRTRAEAQERLDGIAERHDMEFAAALGVFLHDNTLLLAELEVARMYRGWLSSATGENPVVGA